MTDNLDNEIEIQVGADIGNISESLKSVVVIPITSGPIFPGMIVPIVLTEEKFVPELEQYITKQGHVGLNLMKLKGKRKGPYSRKILFYPEEDDKSNGTEKNNLKDKDKNKDKDKDQNKEIDKSNKDRIKEKNRDKNKDKDVYKIGVICKVIKKLKLPDGSVNLLVHGLRRYRALNFMESGTLLMATPEIYEEVAESDSELDAYTRSVINQVKKLSELNPYFNEEMKLAMLNSPSPGALADLVAFALSLDIPEAQDFLETLIVKRRFAKLLIYLKREKEVTDIQKKITDEVNDKVGKYQKEYFLKEQLKVIRHELGMEEDEKGRDLKKLKEAIVKAELPNDVNKIALEELEKLETTPDSSPEYNVVRSYLSWLTQLPWNKSSNETVDIKKSEGILERDHYGLERPKQRILEFLAVRKLRPQYDGTILCFAGPPGVGKTSLGKSIATSLGREFYRFSLGGMKDEAEIKGHRRTYIGAMPGKLIQAIKRVEVNNPVIMLDEIDKLGQSFQGDPASALLEVLDPEQNIRFIDNYLDVPFDLSKVLFIATANYIAEIPEPLVDRMEIIELSGYTLEEKISIARKWVIPKQLKKHGLSSREVIFSVATIKKIIADYAREPGIRSMEQSIAKLCRRAAFLKVKENKKQFSPKTANLDGMLGVPRFYSEIAGKDLKPGVVIGLAWTPYGGEILRIECIPLQGKGMKITGQLGDVMSESANLAYSYVKGILQAEIETEEKKIKKEEKNKKKEKREKKEDKKHRSKNVNKKNGRSGVGGRGHRPDCKFYNDCDRVCEYDNGCDCDSVDDSPKDFLSTHEVHLHIPAGATPKDGPSAGITMALAFYSLAHNTRVKSSVTMTGELSLTGRVLPIGGLKEKLLAAKRAGICKVIYPEENKKDLKEVPARHLSGLTLYPVKHFKDVLKLSLVNFNNKKQKSIDKILG